MASTIADPAPGAIVDVLRSLIIRGALAPGEHLGQAELAARFDLSKVPIREALKQLAAEGLLRHDLNRGYFVAPLSLDEARQLYRLRRWIESELLASARWPDSSETAAFRAGFERLDEMARSGEHAVWAEMLKELRASIFDLSPDKILLREAFRLWSLTDRYRAVMPHNSVPPHERDLVEALVRRDRSALLAAYHSARDQVEGALADVLEVREPA